MNTHPVRIRVLLLVCLLSATPTAWAQPASAAFGIPFFTAHYVLKKLGLTVATVTIRFDRENGQLVYRQVTLPAGIIAWFRHDRITEESLLADTATPQPVEYRFLHTGDGSPKQAVIHFDRKQGLATGHMQNDDPVHVSIQPDTLDRMSLQLALMQAVAHGVTPLRFTTVETKDKLSHYDFHDLGQTVTVTPLGHLKTIHLQRFWQAKHIRFDFYLAPSLHDMPVKLTQTGLQDDSHLSLYLQSVSWH